MADLTITAANVVPVTGYGFRDMTAGEAITRGMPVYEATADSKAYKGDNNDTAAKAAVVGIALNDAAGNQPIRVQTTGNLGFGVILTVGEIYCLSATAGAICPEGDLASTNYVTILGVATTTSNLKLGFLVSGAQVP